MSVSQQLESAPRRVLNLKAVAICVVVIGVVSFGMRRLHSRQVEKTTAHLKRVADQTAEQGTSTAAIRALERYLVFNPGDATAREQLSTLLNNHASDEETLRRVYAMNEDLLMNDSDNTELRLRQAKLAVRLKLFSDADSHLTNLRAALQHEPEVWYLSGVVEEQAARVPEAIDCYRTALDLGSSEARCCVRLAHLLTADGKPAEKIEPLFDGLISDHPSADAHRAKANWLLSQDRTKDAVTEIWAGLKFDPDDILLNGLLASGSQPNLTASPKLLQQGDRDVIAHLGRVVDRQPSIARLRLFYAHAQWAAGQRKAAVETLQAGLSRNPHAFELHEVLIDYLVGLGKSTQAEETLQRLPRSAVNHARWHFLEGRVHMGQERWQQAAVSFEQASGFSGANERVRHRARLCLAACHRKLGEQDGALETYRTMIQTSPDAEDSRLGLAAAWLDAGRLDLAIAEYRHLKAVDGVPELLASLLIRETLQRPATRRDWSEAEQLLRDEEPIVRDVIQRRLLQADLLFAQGYPARALRSLDTTVRQHPRDSTVLSARRRVFADVDGRLLDRLNETIQHKPHSLEAWTASLRLRAQGHQHDLATSWLTQTAADQRQMQVAAQAAEQTASDCNLSGEEEAAAAMLNVADTMWTQLVMANPALMPNAVGFLARHRDTKRVLESLRQMPPETESGVQAQSWVAALENSEHKDDLREAAERSLRRLISGQPGDMRLRQAYVEHLLQFADYDSALTIQRQILQQEPLNAVALSRCAWILTMSKGDHDEALTLSESASRNAPSNSEIRTVRALVLAHSESPDAALPVLRSIPTEARSAASYVYEALALLRTGNPHDAVRATDSAKHQSDPQRWCPADQQLLKDILSQAASADVAHR